MDNVNFLSVRGTAVRVVCFATVIWSRNATHSLSRTGNRGRCLTRPNNSCEGHKCKSGTDVFYFRSEVLLYNRDSRPQDTCVRSDKLVFFSFCQVFSLF